MSIVTLNVGGTTFQTTKDTLLKSGNIFFDRLLSSDNNPLLDDKGAIFIDRSGVLFEYVLRYFRGNSINMDDILREEFTYYGIEIEDKEDAHKKDAHKEDEDEDKHICEIVKRGVDRIKGEDPFQYYYIYFGTNTREECRIYIKKILSSRGLDCIIYNGMKIITLQSKKEGYKLNSSYNPVYFIKEGSTDECVTVLIRY